MLTVEVPARETYNEQTNEFSSIPGVTLHLEHSLIALSKWEERWHIPFLGVKGRKDTKTEEQIADYIRCMTISPKDLPPEFYLNLSPSVIAKVNEYIEDSHTATIFSTVGAANSNNRGETITAELLYYWMFRMSIPMECQKWHLNRLLALIQLCDIKDNPKKKRRHTKADLAARRQLNEQRRAQYNTNG